MDVVHEEVLVFFKAGLDEEDEIDEGGLGCGGGFADHGEVFRNFGFLDGFALREGEENGQRAVFPAETNHRVEILATLGGGGAALGRAGGFVGFEFW